MSLSRCIRSLAIAFRLTLWVRYFSQAAYNEIKAWIVGGEWKPLYMFVSFALIGYLMLLIVAPLSHTLASLPLIAYVGIYLTLVFLLMLTTFWINHLDNTDNMLAGICLFMLAIILYTALGIYTYILYFYYIAVHIAFFTTLGAGMHILFSCLLVLAIMLLTICITSVLYTLITTLYVSKHLNKVVSLNDKTALARLFPIRLITNDKEKIKFYFREKMKKIKKNMTSNTLPLALAKRCRESLLYGEKGLISQCRNSLIKIEYTGNNLLYSSWERFYHDIKLNIWGSAWGCMLIEENALRSFIKDVVFCMGINEKNRFSTFCKTLEDEQKRALCHFANVNYENQYGNSRLNANKWDESDSIDQYVIIKMMLYCFCEDMLTELIAIKTAQHIFSQTPTPSNKLRAELHDFRDISKVVLTHMGLVYKQEEKTQKSNKGPTQKIQLIATPTYDAI